MDKNLGNRPDNGPESDDEDEMPDYRVLSAMTKRHTAGSEATPSIPKRGEKDFEPTGFGGQAKLLDQSRAALFGAISLERAHSNRTLSTATWDPVFNRAFLHTQRGQSFAHVGTSERRVIDGEKQPATIELLPEETVHLIERGALDCRWTLMPGKVPSVEDHAKSVPLSVAQAYSLVLGKDGSTFERYQIYAYLKRLGYIVQRATVTEAARAAAAQAKPRVRISKRILRLLRLLLAYLARPLVWLIRVLNGYWRRCFMAPRGLLGISPYDSHVLEPFYYAWRPATHFKRTAPPPPEFRICVIDTKQQSLFNLREFGSLFATVPLEDDLGEELADVRSRNRQAYGKPPRRRNDEKTKPDAEKHHGLIREWIHRVLAILERLVTLIRTSCSHRPRRSPGNIFPLLKAGRHSVVVAIVEQGTASLLRFGEAEFERLRIAG
ncbi:tRNA-splicing endonuclease subunit sen54 [Malassezia cuniculi]|uniref:tRNA-splicing endonuclease subunit sen54 n=1 Tax=Malassezia cuniculi TaxID=948313 RepID=A0AAF0F067_9BASI|nr:tRNA-splicing endonuclease subunit sen54 [Malassezia cuniculi]